MQENARKAGLVDFYYDYASPYAYLASETVTREIPGIELRYKPVYLRGFETFRNGVPFSMPKLRYMAVDVARCARLAGVPFRQPRGFPINGLYALRGAFHALDQGEFEQYHPAIYRAAWGEDQPISDVEGVLKVVESIGLDRDRYAAALADEHYKQRLREATDAAIAGGVFGLPSFIVDGQLFWGADRLHHLRDWLEHSKS